MSDILARICADKLQHVQARKSEIAPKEMRRRALLAKDDRPPRGFRARLRNVVDAGHFALIAEIKRASPSKGMIRPDFDAPALAKAYRQGGAACLSVLTDVPYFQGADSFLRAARDVVDLPVLRKDFMLDPYQIDEARALGADCVLLILAAISDSQATELEDAAIELGMDVLIEAHDAREIERALSLRSPLIGINNRDLKSLVVDLATTEHLATLVPGDRMLVAESGLNCTADLERMQRVGVNIFLVGESLMRAADVTMATRALLGRHAPPIAA